jgi:hypothetical protein
MHIFHHGGIEQTKRQTLAECDPKSPFIWSGAGVPSASCGRGGWIRRRSGEIEAFSIGIWDGGTWMGRNNPNKVASVGAGDQAIVGYFSRDGADAVPLVFLIRPTRYSISIRITTTPAAT